MKNKLNTAITNIYAYVYTYMYSCGEQIPDYAQGVQGDRQSPNQDKGF